MGYGEFLARKADRVRAGGKAVADGEICAKLFPFQRALVRWALGVGRAAVFADCGLGKTFVQLEWARLTGVPALIVAPLCVSEQTVREARKLGMDLSFPGGGGIEVTNYERLHRVDPSRYGAVVLDESSILKAVDGKTRKLVTEMFADTPLRLCCTATPAPNDTAELANHVEFLGVMRRPEFLATFFVHDDAGWRLKGHGRDAFWGFLTSWATFARRPSDLGYGDEGWDLPELRVRDAFVASPSVPGAILPELAALGGVGGRLRARQSSIEDRVAKALELVGMAPGRSAIVWCGLNAEQDAVARALGAGCVSVTGADAAEEKTRKLLAFLDGAARVLVTKPRIAGFGMNFQHCARMVFLGMSDSYEQYYQCIRRCWRFGQKSPVDVWVVAGRAERAVVENVRRKERENADMARRTVDAVRGRQRDVLGADGRAAARPAPDYEGKEEFSGDGWRLVRGDAVERLADLEPESVDLSVFSPPFLSLYTYTATPRDLGNSRDDAEFLEHFRWVAEGLLRATTPGRIACVHVAQVATTLSAHGVIGLRDFRGMTIRLFQGAGWVYHGEVCVDKDPQAQAIRTHSKALLFVQLRKDSSWLRPGLADYVLLFRAPGENAAPVKPDIGSDLWIEWARPVWYGVRESDTLNVREARAHADDRHIVPLQLELIERCVRLWSNPGDLVLSPFAGIGSEGFVAVQLGRRFHGIELKPEYAATAVRNLRRAEKMRRQKLLTGVGHVRRFRK